MNSSDDEESSRSLFDEVDEQYRNMDFNNGGDGDNGGKGEYFEEGEGPSSRPQDLLERSVRDAIKHEEFDLGGGDSEDSDEDNFEPSRANLNGEGIKNQAKTKEKSVKSEMGLNGGDGSQDDHQQQQYADDSEFQSSFLSQQQNEEAFEFAPENGGGRLNLTLDATMDDVSLVVDEVLDAVDYAAGLEEAEQQQEKVEGTPPKKRGRKRKRPMTPEIPEGEELMMNKEKRRIGRPRKQVFVEGGEKAPQKSNKEEEGVGEEEEGEREPDDDEFPKEPQVFQNEYAEKFKFIERSEQGEQFAHCTLCDCDIDLGAKGADAIRHHRGTKLHKSHLGRMCFQRMQESRLKRYEAAKARSQAGRAAAAANRAEKAKGEKSCLSLLLLQKEGENEGGKIEIDPTMRDVCATMDEVLEAVTFAADLEGQLRSKRVVVTRKNVNRRESLDDDGDEDESVVDLSTRSSSVEEEGGRPKRGPYRKRRIPRGEIASNLRKRDSSSKRNEFPEYSPRPSYSSSKKREGQQKSSPVEGIVRSLRKRQSTGRGKTPSFTAIVSMKKSERKAFAIEGLWAYHYAMHGTASGASRSTECLSSVVDLTEAYKAQAIPSFTTKEQRMKLGAIISRALVPWMDREIAGELAPDRRFSLSIGVTASHPLAPSAKKMFAVCVRFFAPDREGAFGAQLQHRLLDLIVLDHADAKGKQIKQFSNSLRRAMGRLQLSLDNLVGVCLENAPEDFGFGSTDEECGRKLFADVFLGGQGRVPKDLFTSSPVPFLHALLRQCCDQLRVDIESIVGKMIAHFRSPASRTVPSLRMIWETLDTVDREEFRAAHVHGSPHWIAYQALLMKMIGFWEQLRVYFTSTGPLLLQQFFSSPSCQLICSFLSQALALFAPTIDALQKENLLLPELYQLMDQFVKEVQRRYYTKFTITTKVELLRRIQPEDARQLQEEFEQFLRDVWKCSEAWLDALKERFPWLQRTQQELDWVFLRRPEISPFGVLTLARQLLIDGESEGFGGRFEQPQLDEEALRRETTGASQVLRGIPKMEFARLIALQKWAQVFSTPAQKVYHGKEGHPSNSDSAFPTLKRLVEHIVALPSSSSGAFTQKAFRELGNLCAPDGVGRMHSDFVQRAIVRLRVNCLGVDCPQMFSLLSMENNDFLQRISQAITLAGEGRTDLFEAADLGQRDYTDDEDFYSNQGSGREKRVVSEEPTTTIKRGKGRPRKNRSKLGAFKVALKDREDTDYLPPGRPPAAKRPKLMSESQKNRIAAAGSKKSSSRRLFHNDSSLFDDDNGEQDDDPFGDSILGVDGALFSPPEQQQQSDDFFDYSYNTDAQYEEAQMLQLQQQQPCTSASMYSLNRPKKPTTQTGKPMVTEPTNTRYQQPQARPPPPIGKTGGNTLLSSPIKLFKRSSNPATEINSNSKTAGGSPVKQKFGSVSSTKFVSVGGQKQMQQQYRFQNRFQQYQQQRPSPQTQQRFGAGSGTAGIGRGGTGAVGRAQPQPGTIYVTPGGVVKQQSVPPPGSGYVQQKPPSNYQMLKQSVVTLPTVPQLVQGQGQRPPQKFVVAKGIVGGTGRQQQQPFTSATPVGQVLSAQQKASAAAAARIQQQQKIQQRQSKNQPGQQKLQENSGGSTIEDSTGLQNRQSQNPNLNQGGDGGGEGNGQQQLMMMVEEVPAVPITITSTDPSFNQQQRQQLSQPPLEIVLVPSTASSQMTTTNTTVSAAAPTSMMMGMMGTAASSSTGAGVNYYPQQQMAVPNIPFPYQQQGQHPYRQL